MRDADSGKLPLESLERALELVEAHPARLEVPPGKPAGHKDDGADRDCGHHGATL